VYRLIKVLYLPPVQKRQLQLNVFYSNAEPYSLFRFLRILDPEIQTAADVHTQGSKKGYDQHPATNEIQQGTDINDHGL
jgi:hypothetical protein